MQGPAKGNGRGKVKKRQGQRRKVLFRRRLPARRARNLRLGGDLGPNGEIRKEKQATGAQKMGKRIGLSPGSKNPKKMEGQKGRGRSDRRDIQPEAAFVKGRCQPSSMSNCGRTSEGPGKGKVGGRRRGPNQKGRGGVGKMG